VLHDPSNETHAPDGSDSTDAAHAPDATNQVAHQAANQRIKIATALRSLGPAWSAVGTRTTLRRHQFP